MCHHLARSLCRDGVPHSPAAIDYKAVARLHVQSRERSAIGIVAGGDDGIARAIHLGRERHIAEVRTADGHTCDGCRGCHASACNALTDAVDGGHPNLSVTVANDIPHEIVCQAVLHIQCLKDVIGGRAREQGYKDQTKGKISKFRRYFWSLPNKNNQKK